MPETAAEQIHDATTDISAFARTILDDDDASPPTPAAPERIRARKRQPSIRTLNGLHEYLYRATAPDAVPPEGMVGFYSDRLVTVVLDEDSPTERETVVCNLERHRSLQRWAAICGKPIDQASLMSFLRVNQSDLDLDDAGRQLLVGAYASLRGELTHDAEEHLDQQGRSVTFRVRRKVGGKDQVLQVDDVPTVIPIRVKILEDDMDWTHFAVQVQMRGDEGARIVFTLTIVGLDEIVQEHVATRLAGFAESAGFRCVPGVWQEVDWAEPKLPASVRDLMELQARQLAAARSGDRDDE